MLINKNGSSKIIYKNPIRPSGEVTNGTYESKRIKMLFGITLPEIGGAQKVVYDIIESLSEEKYDITLVTSPGEGLTDWVKKLNQARSLKVNIVTISNIKHEISPLNDAIALFKIYRIIKKGKFQIVHFHSSKMGILGRFAAWLARVPKILYTVHGWATYASPSKIKYKVFSLLERIAKKFSTRVICVSNYDLHKGIENKWVDKKKACVIPNGIADYSFPSGKLRKELKVRDNTIIIGTIARLKEPKDPIFTIKVFHELKSRGYNVILVIIGSGPLKEQCAGLVYDLGLNKDVFLLGSRDDARELLCDFDIFTLFSKSEGLPLSIIEAMLSGKPVIASNVGGIPELIQDRINGYLVGGDDVVKCADLIGILLSSDNSGHKMGLAGKKLANKYFTKEKMTSLYELLYKQSEKRLPIIKKSSVKKKAFWEEVL